MTRPGAVLRRSEVKEPNSCGNTAPVFDLAMICTMCDGCTVRRTSRNNARPIPNMGRVYNFTTQTFSHAINVGICDFKNTFLAWINLTSEPSTSVDDQWNSGVLWSDDFSEMLIYSTDQSDVIGRIAIGGLVTKVVSTGVKMVVIT